MLTSEEAAQRLREHHNPKWLKERLAALGKLPGRLRKLARLLLESARKRGSDSAGKERADQFSEGVEQLEDLEAADRVRVFEVVYAKLAEHVEGAWQRSYHLSYLNEVGRRLFRAPSLPAMTRPLRARLLLNLLRTIEGYDACIVWLASWAPHLGDRSDDDELGLLFAVAVDGGGPQADAVFDVLCRSARGEHPSGSMGRQVTRGLALCSRREGWELLLRLLREDPGQEHVGLVILESIDGAPPDGFRWFLKQFLQDDLVHSSSIVHTLDVWLGYQWDAVGERVVRGVVEKILNFTERPQTRHESIASADAENAYLALWATAYEDAAQAAYLASELLESANVERRFVAVHLLGQLDLPLARSILVEAVDDADPRVALHALEWCQADETESAPELGLFERVERLLDRLPQEHQALEPILWPWQVLVADRSDLMVVLEETLGERPPSRMVPYLLWMGPASQQCFLDGLGKPRTWDASDRFGAISSLAGADPAVRGKALQALAQSRLDLVDLLSVEALLALHDTELRNSVLELLATQRDRAVLASVQRLLGSAMLQKRLAGLELIRRLLVDKRLAEPCRECLSHFAVVRRHPRAEEQKVLEQLRELSTTRKRKSP